jgi:hypothetical protein
MEEVKEMMEFTYLSLHLQQMFGNYKQTSFYYSLWLN